jgi:hypothetical protein
MLRKEIESSKERMFKLAVGGIIGLPSAYSIIAKSEMEVLIYSLPLLICTILLLCLSESFAVMRAGRYIRDRIEPHIVDAREGIKGWEEWLEERPRARPGGHRRLVDHFLTYFFYILFAFYYVASVVLAVTAASKYEAIGVAASLATYISVGILFVAFLVVSFNRAVSTGVLDRHPESFTGMRRGKPGRR